MQHPLLSLSVKMSSSKGKGWLALHSQHIDLPPSQKELLVKNQTTKVFFRSLIAFFQPRREESKGKDPFAIPALLGSCLVPWQVEHRKTKARCAG